MIRYISGGAYGSGPAKEIQVISHVARKIERPERKQKSKKDKSKVRYKRYFEK